MTKYSMVVMIAACGGGAMQAMPDAATHDSNKPDASTPDGPQSCPDGEDLPTSCGPECLRCPQPAHGTNACSNGTCTYTCDSGYHACTTGCCLDLQSIAVGGPQACAIRSDGALLCWGGDTGNLKAAISQGFTSGIASVALGEQSTCVLTTGGGVQCWGRGDEGELGNGGTADSATPVAVTGLASGVTAIAAGDDFYCALTTAGGVKCWGHAGEGQLGDGTAKEMVATPVQVYASGVAAIGASYEAACAVMTTGAMNCWGDNTLTHNEAGPVAVNISNAVAIAGGDTHICALTSAGTVECFGDNFYGPLGDGTNNDADLSAPTQAAVSNVTQIAGGDGFSCATSAGAAMCWGGGGEGEIGDDDTANALSPVGVTGLGGGVTQVATGITALSACALVNGAVWCWGWNNAGQVGDQTTGNQRNTPVQVIGI